MASFSESIGSISAWLVPAPNATGCSGLNTGRDDPNVFSAANDLTAGTLTELGTKAKPLATGKTDASESRSKRIMAKSCVVCAVCVWKAMNEIKTFNAVDPSSLKPGAGFGDSSTRPTSQRYRALGVSRDPPIPFEEDWPSCPGPHLVDGLR